MPAAKKTTSRRTTQKSGEGRITRREVEAATKRFDKALDDATAALQTMGANLGRNAKSTYREVERALRTLRRDAQKANRSVIKDLEKIWASAGSSSTASRSRSAAKSTSAGASKARSTAAKSTGSRSSASKSSTTAKSSTAKSSTAAKPSSAKKRAPSGSRTNRRSS